MKQIRIGLVVLWLLLATDVLLGILYGWTQVAIFSVVVVVIIVAQTHIAMWKFWSDNIASIKEHKQYGVRRSFKFYGD